MARIGSVSGRVEIESKDPLRNIYSPDDIAQHNIKYFSVGRANKTAKLEN